MFCTVINKEQVIKEVAKREGIPLSTVQSLYWTLENYIFEKLSSATSTENVEIKLLKTIDDINIIPESKIMSLNSYELKLLWDYCIKLLKEWKDNELVLNHNECFLVGYCYLLLDKAKILNVDIGTEQQIKDAISVRFDMKDTNRIIVIGKDISKRGIPIYKDLK